MKKIKVIVAAILRGVIILLPGAAFLYWAWTKVSAIFSILATVGVEVIYLLVFAFMVAVVRAVKDLKKKKSQVAD